MSIDKVNISNEQEDFNVESKIPSWLITVCVYLAMFVLLMLNFEKHHFSSVFLGLILALFLGSLGLLLLGLFKPNKVHCFGKNSRKGIAATYCGGIVLSFIAFLMFSYVISNTPEGVAKKTLYGSWEVNLEKMDSLGGKALVNLTIKELKLTFYEDGTFLFAGSVLNHNRIEHGDYWLESEDGKIYLKMQADNQEKIRTARLRMLSRDHVLLIKEGSTESLKRIR